jgi:hypothetical protein
MFRSAVLKSFFRALNQEPPVSPETLLLPFIVAFLTSTMSIQQPSATNVHIESVGALLRHPGERKYLLIERNPNYARNTNNISELEYPGGNFEDADMDAIGCATRKIQDEANITIPAEQLDTGLLFKTYNPRTGKWVYLIEAKLTNDQADQANIDTINRRLSEKSVAFPSSTPALSLKWVSEGDLRQLANGITREGIVHPLRGFNRVVLSAYFNAK